MIGAALFLGLSVMQPADASSQPAPSASSQQARPAAHRLYICDRPASGLRAWQAEHGWLKFTTADRVLAEAAGPADGQPRCMTPVEFERLRRTALGAPNLLTVAGR